MGAIGRLVSLVTGKADVAADSAAKQDVDAVFHAAIMQEEKELTDIRNLAKEVKGHEFAINEKITQKNAEKADLQKTLDLAINEKNQEIGATLVQQMDAIDKELIDLQAQLVAYQKESEETIKALHAQEQHVADLKTEATTAKSTVEANAILTKIRDRKKGIGTTAADKNLEAARTAVNAAKADRMATIAVDNESSESKVAAFKEKVAASSAADRFNAMLAKKGGANA